MPRILSMTLLAIAASAAAVEEVPATIIITADRREGELERTPLSVEVVTAEDMRRRGSPTEAIDWFRELPGVGVFSRYGGLDGGAPDIRIRGLDAAYTQVVVDGIPLNNPTAIGGDLNFAFLTPAGIERIEILKGPQSGLYGSRAVAGVAGLRTIRPTATSEVGFSTTAGSFGTVASSVQATGPIGASTGYAVAVQGLRSDGFSATTPDQDGDPRDYESDALRRLSYDLRLEWRPDQGTTCYASAMGGRLDQELDDTYYDAGFNVLLDRTANDTVAENHVVSNRYAVGAAHDDDHFEWGGDLALSTMLIDNRTIYGSGYVNGPVPDPVTVAYRGREVFAGGRAFWKPVAGLRLGLGVDGMWQQAAQDREDLGLLWTDHQRTTGTWVQAGWSGPNLEIDAVGRHDQQPGFDSHDSGRLAGAVMTESRSVKVRGSVGNGFRAPSLYERYGVEQGGFPYIGNPDLTAERFVGYEGGIDLRPLPGASLSATWFRTRFSDKIIYDYVSFPNTRQNLGGQSVTTGLETSAQISDIGHSGIDIAGDWTRQRSVDPDGNRLAFDPKDRGGVRVTARQQAGGRLQLWQSVRVERTTEYFSGAGEGGRVDGYTVVSAVAGATLDAHWDLSLRVENLTDERYIVTSAYGVAYSTLPRSYFVTLGGRF